MIEEMAMTFHPATFSAGLFGCGAIGVRFVGRRGERLTTTGDVGVSCCNLKILIPAIPITSLQPLARIL